MSKFSERHYIKHYRTAHNDIPPEFIDKKQYLCSECPEIYFNKESFNTHIWKHKETSKLPAKQFDCKRLDTIQDIFLRVGHETTYASKTCSCPIVQYFRTLFWDKNIVYLRKKNCFGPIRSLFT